MFLDKEIAKKNFYPAGGSWIFFISPGRWIGNEQLFNVGLIYFIVTFSNDFNLTMWLAVTTKSFVISNK